MVVLKKRLSLRIRCVHFNGVPLANLVKVMIDLLQETDSVFVFCDKLVSVYLKLNYILIYSKLDVCKASSY